MSIPCEWEIARTVDQLRILHGVRQAIQMHGIAADAIRSENATLPRVLGGMSPIDPRFLLNLQSYGVGHHVDAVAVHGFPLDWNHWQLNDWPAKLGEIRQVTDLPIWITEVGISTFGAEEVQEWGLKRTGELLRGRADFLLEYTL